MYKNFLSSFVSLFVGRVASLVFALLSASLLARGLGPDGNGDFALALLLPASVQMLGGMSIGPAIVHYIAKNKKNKNNLSEIFGAIIFLNFLLSVFQLIVTIVIAIFFSKYLLQGVNLGFVYLTATLGFFVLASTCQADSFLGGLDEFKYLGKITVYVAPMAPAVYLVLYYFELLTVPLAIWVNFTALFFAGIVKLLKVRKLCGSPSFNNLTYWNKKLLKFGLACHCSNVVTFFNYRLDMFILNYYFGKKVTGFYNISVNITERIWLVSSICAQIIFSRISNMHSQGEQYNLTRVIAIITLVITIFCSIFLWLIAPNIVIFLFGKDYTSCIDGIRWLLPGICALSVSRIFSNTIAGRGKPHINTNVSIVTLVSNVVLNFIFIPQMGLKGAALATSISYIFAGIMSYLYFIREFKVTDESTS